MKLALDTNVLIEIDLFNSEVIARLKELREEAPLSPAIPAPVVSEYYYGFLGSRKKVKILENLKKYEILNTSKNSALLLAELKYSLTKSGKIIPDMDMLVAAICIDTASTLITFDKQFEDIKELNKIILEF